MVREQRTYNVLFLCTHNSARSIMAEAILADPALNLGKFKAYSAGSMPANQPHPLALEQIARAGLPTQGLRSKSWDEFASPDAPQIDFVFTVCDNAAREACPVWPGHPVTAHWGLPDPSRIEGTEEDRRRAFGMTFRELATRIRLLVSLPFDALDDASLRKRLDEIGTGGARP
jgi:arsenate reductase